MAQGTGFWSDAVTEPKRQFRWLLNINGIDSWIIKSVTNSTSLCETKGSRTCERNKFVYA